MRIAVLKEHNTYETRVALVPEDIKKLIASGHQVSVEQSAGIMASFSDDSYQNAGATLVSERSMLFKDAEIIVGVGLNLCGDYFDSDLRKDALIVGLLSPYDNQDHFAHYAEKRISLLALELIPRISRAQSLDVLSSQANLAGYRAVIEAANAYDRAFPLMMTAAGTIKPARVLILGAGVAGLQAIATAKRLGAVVSAFDVRPEVKEQVQSLGAKFVEVPLLESSQQQDQSSNSSGGYATEMSEDYKAQQAKLIHEHACASDIVITTAQIPGRKAPRLIALDTIQKMRPGAVIVDMATASGGNVDGSKADKISDIHSVKIIGYSNLPGRLAAESSSLFSKNIMNLFKIIINDDHQLNLDLSDDILNASLVTHGGERRFGQDTKASNSGKKSQAVNKIPTKDQSKDKPSGKIKKAAGSQAKKPRKKDK